MAEAATTVGSSAHRHQRSPLIGTIWVVVDFASPAQKPSSAVRLQMLDPTGMQGKPADSRVWSVSDGVLTRIERQFGGGRIPPALSTLSEIRESGASCGPFEDIEFLPFMVSWDSVFELKGSKFVSTLGVSTLINDRGFAETKQILDARGCRNTDRLLERIARDLTSSGRRALPDLSEIYRRRLSEQMAT